MQVGILMRERPAAPRQLSMTQREPDSSDEEEERAVLLGGQGK